MNVRKMVERVTARAAAAKPAAKAKAVKVASEVSNPPQKPCPFDALRVKPPLSHKQILIVKISEILEELRRCCVLNPGAPFKMPKGEQLSDLDTAVSSLSAAFRARRKPRWLWEGYTIVDRQVSSLKLASKVRDLLERAQKNIPKRPLEAFAQIVRKKPQTSASVGRLFSAIKEFRSARPPVSEEQWREHRNDFSELLEKHLDFITPPLWKEFAALFWEIGDHNRSIPEAECKRTFVQMEQDDRHWETRYDDGARVLVLWVIFDLKNDELLPLLERFIVPGISLHPENTPERLREWSKTSREKGIAKRQREQNRQRQTQKRNSR